MSGTLATEVFDLYGNTKTATTPPPVLKKSPVSAIQQESTCEGESVEGHTDRQYNIISYNEDELLTKINNLSEPGSKLSSKELDFYKKKLDSNIAKILQSDHTKIVLSQIFDETDKKAAVKTIKHWMVTDTTISNWCPAFLKLFENQSQK